jgi:hypothetical protein
MLYGDSPARSNRKTRSCLKDCWHAMHAGYAFVPVWAKGMKLNSLANGDGQTMRKNSRPLILAVPLAGVRILQQDQTERQGVAWRIVDMQCMQGMRLSLYADWALWAFFCLILLENPHRWEAFCIRLSPFWLLFVRSGLYKKKLPIYGDSPARSNRKTRSCLKDCWHAMHAGYAFVKLFASDWAPFDCCLLGQASIKGLPLSKSNASVCSSWISSAILSVKKD